MLLSGESLANLSLTVAVSVTSCLLDFAFFPQSHNGRRSLPLFVILEVYVLCVKFNSDRP